MKTIKSSKMKLAAQRKWYYSTGKDYHKDYYRKNKERLLKYQNEYNRL